MLHRKVQRFKEKYGYSSIDEMSVLHLGIIARQLGIDVESIRSKHLDALGAELTEAIKKVVKERR